MNEVLEVNNLIFNVKYSDRRKTVGITVERDGRLTLSAPVDCPTERIKKIAAEKTFWVYTKLAEKEQLWLHNNRKEFVTGEGFNYLGRHYRLKLVDPKREGREIPPLRLKHGRFLLRRDEKNNARKHFIDWYIARGQPKVDWFINLYKDRVGVNPKSFEVRDIGYRWGSCNPKGSVYIHWRSILLPPRIIEYIVVHELIHLRINNHTPEFWHRLELAMPDFASRKQWLAENGGRYGV